MDIISKSRRNFLGSGSLLAGEIAPCTRSGKILANTQEKPSYRSPYRLRFPHAVEELRAGLGLEPFSDARLESGGPHRDWYFHAVRSKYGAWGRHAGQYPAAPEIHRRCREWLRDRIVLTASRWIGTPFQHHHIPDGNSPGGWPWKNVGFGRNSEGIDRSNFSSFYYNNGLRVKLDPHIRVQAERQKVRGPGGRGALNIERGEYESLTRRLDHGGLSYIRNNSGTVAPVMMFLGFTGESADVTPMVIDSNGWGHVNREGQKIPIGERIRHSGRNSRYRKSMARAYRLVNGMTRMTVKPVAKTQQGGVEEATESG